MTEWHRIDDPDWPPPRDGTDILVARFDGDASDWYAVAQWWVEKFAFMYADSRQYPHPILLCFEPTYWMHIPPPPPSRF